MIHFGKKRIPVVFFIILFLVNCPPARKTYSDNNDGTHTSQAIFEDFPDPDVIVVCDAYYMDSTKMSIFPRVKILKSCDLVNWEYCSSTVPRFDFNPCYNLDGCTRYRHGKWDWFRMQL
jgi:beta-xylosidase